MFRKVPRCSSSFYCEFAYRWNGWNEMLGSMERKARYSGTDKGQMASYPEEESLVSHFIGAVCELVYW